MAKQDTEETFSGVLLKALQSTDLSLRELARRAEIDVSQLSRFVKGQRDLTLEAAARLGKVLGLQTIMPPLPATNDTVAHSKQTDDTKHQKPASKRHGDR